MKNLIQLKNEGYTLLKNVFSETQVLSWRKHLLEYMSVKSNRCKSENWLSVKPNAINYTEFSDHLTIFENKNLISFLKEACGGVLKYAHHYDVRMRVQGSGSWTILMTNIFTTSKQKSNLASSTAYEWQVRSACSPDSSSVSAWSASQTFTTLTPCITESLFTYIS